MFDSLVDHHPVAATATAARAAVPRIPTSCRPFKTPFELSDVKENQNDSTWITPPPKQQLQRIRGIDESIRVRKHESRIRHEDVTPRSEGPTTLRQPFQSLSSSGDRTTVTTSETCVLKKNQRPNLILSPCREEDYQSDQTEEFEVGPQHNIIEEGEILEELLPCNLTKSIERSPIMDKEVAEGIDQTEAGKAQAAADQLETPSA